MSDILTATWESMKAPALLGLLVAVCMYLFGKRLIVLIFDAIYSWMKGAEQSCPDDCLLGRLKGAVTNIVTLLLTYWIAWARLHTDAPPGQLWLVAVQGTLYSIVEYEAVKNILGAVNVDIRPFAEVNAIFRK